MKKTKNGKIILLNGVSSSGKTTIAQKLSEKMPNFLVLALDDIGELIFKMRGNTKEPSTWSIIAKQNYSIHFKTFMYHRFAKIISEYSFNIILDTVFDDDTERDDFFELYKDEDIICIGVFCPLNELKKREIERKDREIGIAEAQKLCS